jgi:ADP-heptose:LPS heptosyltransferase
MNAHQPRILILRNDRLGDLVLALPVVRALRRDSPQAFIGLLASAYAAPLLQKDPGLDLVIADGPEALKNIRSCAFDSCLVLWANWNNAWLAFRASIPQRVGPSARPFSLLFTHRVDVRRSEGLRSEAFYNQEFLAPLAVPPVEQAPGLVLAWEVYSQARAWLKKKGLAKKSGPLVMLHPGSGGSAWNWKPERYGQLGRDLMKRHKARILVTGSPRERPLMEKVRSSLAPRSTLLKDPLPLRVFAALLSQADLFVSGSTGPMHLAAATGAPTLSFFPPLRSMSPLRWGPLGNTHAVLTPAGLGIAATGAFAPGTGFEDCMDRISVAEAAGAAGTVLAIGRKR